jgi:hypothetical protein
VRSTCWNSKSCAKGRPVNRLNPKQSISLNSSIVKTSKLAHCIYFAWKCLKSYSPSRAIKSKFGRIFTLWHSIIVNVKSVPLHAKQEQRESWGIPIPTVNSVSRMRLVVSVTLRPRTPGKETPYPFYRRLCGSLVLMSPENHAPTSFRTRDH